MKKLLLFVHVIFVCFVASPALGMHPIQEMENDAVQSSTGSLRSGSVDLRGIAFSSDGKYLYVCDTGTGVVHVLNKAFSKVGTITSSAGFPYTIVQGRMPGEMLLLDTGTLYLISGLQIKKTLALQGYFWTSMSVSKDRKLAAIASYNAVHIVDLVKWTEIKSIGTNVSSCYGIAFSGDTKLVYVNDLYSKSFKVLNWKSESISSIPLKDEGSWGSFPTPDYTNLFLAAVQTTNFNMRTRSLSLIEGYGCWYFSGNDYRIYGTEVIGQAVSVIDRRSNKVLKRIATPKMVHPFGVAISPDSQILAVTGLYSNHVSIMNLRQLKIVKEISL